MGSKKLGDTVALAVGRILKTCTKCIRLNLPRLLDIVRKQFRPLFEDPAFMKEMGNDVATLLGFVVLKPEDLSYVEKATGVPLDEAINSADKDLVSEVSHVLMELSKFSEPETSGKTV